MNTLIQRTGERFGRLVVIGPYERRRNTAGIPSIFWLCRCDCGKEKWIASTNLTTKRGPTRTCGCSWSLRPIRVHGYAGRQGHRHELYATWTQMKARCLNPRSPSYPNYGGRGIRVCDEWKRDFVSFVEDIGPRPSPLHSLDRIDVDGDYSPTNCRWASRHEQGRNKRQTIMVNVGGQSIPIMQALEDALSAVCIDGEPILNFFGRRGYGLQICRRPRMALTQDGTMAGVVVDRVTGERLSQGDRTAVPGSPPSPETNLTEPAP